MWQRSVSWFLFVGILTLAAISPHDTHLGGVQQASVDDPGAGADVTDPNPPASTSPYQDPAAPASTEP